MMQYAALAGTLALISGCAAETSPGRTPGGHTPVDSGHGGSSDAGGGADGGTPGPRPGGDGGACESLTVDARPEPSTVMIVLDRSGSMYDTEIEMVDRWTPSVMAIDSVTTALEDRLSFGLLLFPGDRECATGRVEVTPGVRQAAAIRTALSGDPSSVTGGGTPTAASLDAARAALTSVPGRRSVLLVTDGGPNCNSALDGFSCRCTRPEGGCWLDNWSCLDDDRTVAAVRALRDAGISTYVVGYDTAAWADVMDRMAAEGGTPLSRHIQVTDRASLEGALRDIGGSVVSCSFDLSEPPGDVRYVRVTVDGAPVDHESVRGDGSGWALEGDRTVTLLGPSCDAVQDGTDHTISVVVECTPVII